jgi:hypothetical protein
MINNEMVESIWQKLESIYGEEFNEKVVREEVAI